MDYKYNVYDESETIELAENIESEHFPNMVICLDGELGSGKTVFVKGFAKASGASEKINNSFFLFQSNYGYTYLLYRRFGRRFG